MGSTRSFSATTGRLNSIASSSNNAVQNLAHTYDLLGNLLSRSDAITGISKSFAYDGLSRLTVPLRCGPPSGQQLCLR